MGDDEMTREEIEHPPCEWCGIPIFPDEERVKDDEYGDQYHIRCIKELEPTFLYQRLKKYIRKIEMTREEIKDLLVEFYEQMRDSERPPEFTENIDQENLVDNLADKIEAYGKQCYKEGGDAVVTATTMIEKEG